ncbi:DUF664 domain-containing protein [Streptomyces sp. NPDC017454]|uniref:mycothiol transferase n=1 Tax=Streptomyces sp. NPDC017454 TaxID=3364997 RepID=UPI00378C1100
MNDGRWRASGSPEAMGRTPGRTCASHEAQCARGNEIVAAASSGYVGRHPDYRSGTANLRWMLIHLVEETGRHAGHADVVGELLGGAKGYYQVSPVGRDRSQSRIEATVTVP